MTLGQVLKGRYRIAERIGSGGMSTVYLAHVVDTGQSVAVKVVNEALAFDEQYARRFAQELAIARLLDHPGIPRLIDDGQTEEGVPFLVLEYVQGITLTEYLRKKGPLPIEEAVAIASSVLTILSYAYSKGIQAHRDIKPGNIMIDLRTHAVTVMDFGIAKTVGSSLTHSTVLYTPRYAAPEQLLPSKFGGVVDKRADLYALGVVLYEMLTGRVPFAGETPAEISGEQITSPPPSPSSIRRDIPAPLSQILLTCLQANPSHRYQTPQDLLQDLREGRPSPTRGTTETVIRKPPPVPVEQPRPRPRVPLLVPLLALALVILIPLTIMLVRGAKSEPPVAVTATLTVTSTPPGAQVSLNGTSSGTTPITKSVTPGTYTLLFTLSGYEDYRETITLQAGGTRQVNAPLTKKSVVPTTATLTITSTPPGAQVSLNGTSSGTTPITKSVTPGTYTLLFTLSGYEDYRETITLSTGDTRQVNAPLTKKSTTPTKPTPTTATLTVTSTPSGAQVFLDGKDTGKVTPSTFVLAPGSHDLKVTQDGYLAWDGAVGVGPAGNTQKFDVSLTKFDAATTTATLTVTSTPAGATVFLDGKSIGVTPLRSQKIGAFVQHTLLLSLAGYQDDTRSFTVGSSGPMIVTATLTRIPVTPTAATLTVTSTPTGAQVTLDGSYIGVTPVSIVVSQGPHGVRVTLSGYDNYVSSLVAGNSNIDVNAVLQEKPPLLTITSTPSGARVFLNGTSIGTTPITKTVTPGTYTLLFTLSGYEDYRETITLQAGTPRTVTALLTKISGALLAIGDSYQGGIVAYILQPGDPGYSATVQHGLIAATADQSTGIVWALPTYQTTSVPGTLATFGSGSANTDKIIAQNGAGSTYAAGLARAYRGGGYADWYLPSKNELARLYAMKVLGFGGFAAASELDFYWSSSEGGAYDAWAQNFGSGNQYFGSGSQTYGSKDNYPTHVRAVRTF